MKDAVFVGNSLFEQSGAWASLAGDEWGHNTKERSGIHGMTYMYQRCYSAETGTFLSQDRHPGFADLPKSRHPYQFAYQNPVSRLDPDGNFVISTPITIPPPRGPRRPGFKMPKITPPKNPGGPAFSALSGCIQGQISEFWGIVVRGQGDPSMTVQESMVNQICACASGAAGGAFGSAVGGGKSVGGIVGGTVGGSLGSLAIEDIFCNCSKNVIGAMDGAFLTILEAMR